MRRVYHPTLNAWNDVEDNAADSWKATGWRLTKPDHVNDDDAPAVGDHPGYATIVVDDTGDAPAPVSAPKASKAVTDAPAAS